MTDEPQNFYRSSKSIEYENDIFLQQQHEMELFNSVKQQIYDTFYTGCFLYYLNFDRFVDFINDITYNDTIYKDKDIKRINKFINCHNDIFYQIGKIMGVDFNCQEELKRYYHFVYDNSFKDCICEELCKEDECNYDNQDKYI